MQIGSQIWRERDIVNINMLENDLNRLSLFKFELNEVIHRLNGPVYGPHIYIYIYIYILNFTIHCKELIYYPNLIYLGFVWFG